MAANSDASVRIAFWNTWLLAPRLWSGGPRVPDRGNWFAPDVTERAPLVARAVADRFDVVALSECFDPTEQSAVAGAWPEATFVPGPQRRWNKSSGSGLATLVGPNATLQRQAQHTYRSGGDLRDADTLASKGALFVQVSIDPALPPIEVISTHLFAGGDLAPLRGINDGDRHHRARMAQVDELIGFIEQEHDPAHPLLVIGDFNVPAHDATTSDPQARYRDLAQHMARAELVDLWPAHGVGPGPTCGFAEPADLPQDPDEPDRVLDEANATQTVGQRIDHLWLHTPRDLHLSVDELQRWAFGGRGVTGGPAGSLSDHLALSVTLHLRT